MPDYDRLMSVTERGASYKCGTLFKCWICDRALILGLDVIYVRHSRRFCKECYLKRVQGLV